MSEHCTVCPSIEVYLPDLQGPGDLPGQPGGDDEEGVEGRGPAGGTPHRPPRPHSRQGGRLGRRRRLEGTSASPDQRL